MRIHSLNNIKNPVLVGSKQSDASGFGLAQAPKLSLSLPVSSSYQVFPDSMIHEITRLTRKHNAVTLAQGTPVLPQPLKLRQTTAEAALADRNSYTLVQGSENCLRAIADNRNKELQAAVPYQYSDVVYTAGATEAFHITTQVLLRPGDDIVTPDPYYGLYTGAIQSALGGTAEDFNKHFKTFPMKAVSLGGKKQVFEFDSQAFKQSLTDNTKVVLLINPHNPTGATLSKKHLEEIGQVIDEWEAKHPGKRISVISDETYEHIYFDGNAHTSAASVPNIQKRLFLLGTLSKTFNTTGNRIGYLLVPPSPPGLSEEQEAEKLRLVKSLRNCKNVTSMCGFQGFQDLVTVAYNELATPEYYQSLSKHYQQNRDYLLELLEKSPFKNYSVPQGGYFVMADVSDIIKNLKPDVKAKYKINDSESLVKNFMIPVLKVAVVPGTGLYHNQEEGKKMIRISFCQDKETIEKAFENLKGLKNYLV